MAFNFKVFDTVAMAEEGSTLHLRIPATNELAYDVRGDEKIPVAITFKGPKSQAGRDALTKAQQRTKAVLRKYAKDKDEIISAEDSLKLREINAESFFDMAVSWTGFSNTKDEPLPLTKAEFVNQCMTYLGVYEQINEFILGQQSFLKA